MITDERTAEEKTTHTVVIGGTDKFLSGWGGASCGKSHAYWACRPADEEQVMGWAKTRKDTINVGSYKKNPPKKQDWDHVVVYVVREGHPALDL